MSLVLDTSVVIALLDRLDAAHARCVGVADGPEDLVVPLPILVEVDYWLRKRGRGDAWSALVDQIAARRFRLHRTDEAELTRAAELEAQYSDLGLGFVDASVIAACETLGETKVATLDHRHFSVVRPRHCEALTLLPA